MAVETLEMIPNGAETLNCVRTHLADLLCIPILSITAESSFTQLGGHSLLATELAKQLRDAGVRLSVADILQSPSVTHLCGLAQVTSRSSPKNRDTICSALLKRNNDETESSLPPSIARSHKRARYSDSSASPSPSLDRNAYSSGDSSRPYSPPSSMTSMDDVQSPKRVPGSLRRSVPCTEMQAMFLYGSLMRPGSNVVSFYETYATSDYAQVKSAWQLLISIEPIFRCSLELCEGRSCMVESPLAIPPWSERIVHERDVFDALVGAELKETLLGHAFEAITLDNGKDSHQTTIIWRVNHGLIDGFAADLVFQNLRKILNNITVVAGMPYLDAALSMVEQQRSQKLSNQTFWTQQTQKHPEAVGRLVLPHPKSGSATSTRSTACISARVDAPSIEVLARKSKVSVAAVYHAAWGLVLSAFTNSKDVKFGAVLSGRSSGIDGIEQCIGPMINTLPLSVLVHPEWCVSTFLETVFRSLIELTTVHSSCPEDGFLRDFSSLLAMQFPMAATPADQGPRSLTPSRFALVGDIPISVAVWPNGNIKMDYRIDEYERTDMVRMIEYFTRTLRLLSSGTESMNEIIQHQMPANVETKVLDMSNADSEQTHPEAITQDLVTMFEACARTQHWRTAVEMGHETLTYGDLDRRATHVARHLACTVKVGDVVCVHADRSTEWIVAIYAILKVGATYSALDCKLPQSIRDANFELAGAKTFLVGSQGEKHVTPRGRTNLFSIDELLQKSVSNQPEVPHRFKAQPLRNAYICFTSGSTGKAKGVVCTHAGLVAFHSSEDVRMHALSLIHI